jgi:hypothetical protein
LRRPTPAEIDASMALVGVIFAAWGAALIYPPAGLVVFGLGLFLLGSR